LSPLLFFLGSFVYFPQPIPSSLLLRQWRWIPEGVLPFGDRPTPSFAGSFSAVGLSFLFEVVFKKPDFAAWTPPASLFTWAADFSSAQT